METILADDTYPDGETLDRRYMSVDIGLSINDPGLDPMSTTA